MADDLSRSAELARGYAEQAKAQLDAGAAGAMESALLSLAFSGLEITRATRELIDVLSTPEVPQEADEECRYAGSHPFMHYRRDKCPDCGKSGDELLS